MHIRWIVYTRNKRETKGIIEDAFAVVKNHIQRYKYLSAKPYWKFDDSYVVEMKLKLQDDSLNHFIKFLNGICEYWYLHLPIGGAELIAAANCHDFINKQISWVWIDFDWETEQEFFEELRANMDFIIE